MDDRARFIGNRARQQVDRSARIPSRIGRKDHPTRWCTPSVAARRRRNRIVSVIIPRRALNVPCATLIVPHEKLIVPRPTPTRLLAETTVLWLKRNSSILAWNRTAPFCNCHLQVERHHRAVGHRHGDGANSHLAPKASDAAMAAIATARCPRISKRTTDGPPVDAGTRL